MTRFCGVGFHILRAADVERPAYIEAITIIPTADGDYLASLIALQLGLINFLNLTFVPVATMSDFPSLQPAMTIRVFIIDMAFEEARRLIKVLTGGG